MAVYMAIDLKSFYASVECVERHLNPLTTNLVVADATRSDKTICLAITPTLKAYGLSGRARLFEVIQKVKEVNLERQKKAKLTAKTIHDPLLKTHPEYALSFLSCPPRMAYYIEYSAKIYEIYLKYVDSKDIHVYSIDEVFMDITHYLKNSHKTPYEFCKEIILDVYKSTGITATAGLGDNLYLAKVAMDIMAKHVRADEDGVRIAYLNEALYKEKLWSHRPLTDFWRVGKGIAKRLEAEKIYTMGDIARCSLGASDDYYNEKLLYDLFGVNAELLIDHAWGIEPCTIHDIKKYKPQAKSIGSGQVLSEAYSFDGARLVLKEMIDQLVLDLVDKNLLTCAIVLNVGYDKDNDYQGEFQIDAYGRKLPKQAHGTCRLKYPSCSCKEIMAEVLKLYDRIVDPLLSIRRMNLSAIDLKTKEEVDKMVFYEQLNLFSEPEEVKVDHKEEALQKTIIKLKKKYGKNSVLKGMNLEEGATAKSRNGMIGGHKA